MGVKFGVEDSSNLISAMRNNVLVANMIIDRLNAGSQHLIAHLDSGSLQGAAYTAGRGLFSELIIPGIEKLGEAVDDVHAELASYEHAHSVVAEYGDLDSDDLEQALQDARDRLDLIETQIEINNAFLSQVSGFPGGPIYSADRFDLAFGTQSSLEELKRQVEEEILEIRTKIEKLEWFVADVSRYFSDSLQVMQLATQAAMELGKIAVETDGSYYTNGVNLDLIQGLGDANITTHNAPPGKTPHDAVSFDSLRSASDLSYDKMMQWLSSNPGVLLRSLAQSNPGLFNSVLNNGVDYKTGAIPWGFFKDALAGPKAFGTAVGGGLVFEEKFPTGAEWDMKVYLADEYDYDAGYFYLHDDRGRVVRSDVFGNVVFGIMLADWDVGVETAIRGANSDDALGVDAGRTDDLDDRAVAFGYELHGKYPNGFSQEQFYEEIANANLFLVE